MNRRVFIQRFLGSVIATPILVSCTRNGENTSSASRLSSPTPFPPATDLTSVAGFLKYYAELLQLPVKYNSPDLLLADLSESESKIVRDVNDRMQRNGFTDFSQAVVYGTDELFFYTVGFNDGINACGAFFAYHLNTEAALLEGPTAIGFSKATHDFLRNGADIRTARNVFLPRSTKTEALGLFNKPYRNAGHYNTAAGSVEVNYDTDGKGKGQIALVARNHEGGELFEEVYDIPYQV